MIDSAQRGFSQAVLSVYTPRRSVIIEMVMVQFISIILTMMLVLFLLLAIQLRYQITSLLVVKR